MHIVSSADDGYLPHYAALLHSAHLYNPDASFYLLDTGISPDNRARLLRFADGRRIRLSVIPAADQVLRSLPNYTKRSAFGRLFIPELMPDHVERAIYLDCDMTVIGNISELFASDLENRPFGACRDGFASEIRKESEVQGLPYTTDTYFNSGMLLIDLQRWREAAVTEKVIAFANKNPSRLLFMDQSAFNVEMFGQVKILDSKWNFFQLDAIDTVDTTSIRIIHYAVMVRPWLSPGCPFSELYWYHRNQTPWQQDRFKPKLWHAIRREKRRIFALLGHKIYRSRMQEYRRSETVKEMLADPAQSRAAALAG
ncbi:MAG: glycosyltransferase family 8 protein [Pseudomonadota bacterium]